MMKITTCILILVAALILIAGCTQPVQNVDNTPAVAQVTMLAPNGSYVPAPPYVPPYSCHLESDLPPTGRMGFTFPCNSTDDVKNYTIEKVNDKYEAVYHG